MTVKETTDKMETAYRMGENTCKWSDRQEINLKNIQIAHTTQNERKTTQSKSGWKI